MNTHHHEHSRVNLRATEVQPFLIVKPEMLATGIGPLENALYRRGLTIEARDSVNSWPQAAHELYASLDREELGALNDWLSTIAIIYPAYAERAERWCISGQPDTLDTLCTLGECKRSLRAEHPLGRDIVCMYTSSQSRLPIRFSLIHTPDPKQETLASEWTLIDKYVTPVMR